MLHPVQHIGAPPAKTPFSEILPLGTDRNYRILKGKGKEKKREAYSASRITGHGSRNLSESAENICKQGKNTYFPQ
jgi:hypothetical protein